MQALSQQEAIAAAAPGSWILWEQEGQRLFRLYIAQVIERRGKKTIGPFVCQGRYAQQERRYIIPTVVQMVRWLNECTADFKKARACIQTWEDERANAAVKRMW